MSHTFFPSFPPSGWLTNLVQSHSFLSHRSCHQCYTSGWQIHALCPSRPHPPPSRPCACALCVCVSPEWERKVSPPLRRRESVTAVSPTSRESGKKRQLLANRNAPNGCVNFCENDQMMLQAISLKRTNLFPQSFEKKCSTIEDETKLMFINSEVTTIAFSIFQHPRYVSPPLLLSDSRLQSRCILLLQLQSPHTFLWWQREETECVRACVRACVQSSTQSFVSIVIEFQHLYAVQLWTGARMAAEIERGRKGGFGMTGERTWKCCHALCYVDISNEMGKVGARNEYVQLHFSYFLLFEIRKSCLNLVAFSLI